MAKSETDLRQTLCATAARYAMREPGQTLVAGVSGGPDSVALLHALASLRDEWQLTLVAAHLNHGFRGAESEGDAEYVRRLCAELDVPCRIEFMDVPALQKRLHRSAQQAARNARHAFLRRVAQETTTPATTRIALGHTRNDRVETLLLNLVRGTGLEGLRGFLPVDLPLVRPLFDVTRAQVLDYCARHSLQPRQDSSNADTHYLRNRIRRELLPELRAHYNPNVEEALLRLADIVGEEEEWRAAQATADFQAMNASSAPGNTDVARRKFAHRNRLIKSRFVGPAVSRPADEKTGRVFTPTGTGTSVTWPVEEFNALPLAARRRVLRQGIADARGHLQDVRFAAVTALIDAAETGRRCLLELPATEQGTAQMECDGSQIIIRAKPLQASPVPWQATVNTPGRTIVSQAGVTIHAWFCTIEDMPDIANALDTEIRAAAIVKPESALRGQLLIFARERVTLPLQARSWRRGDRMRPRGLDGTKKLQDLFTDAKIPVPDRARTPVLVETAEIGGTEISEMQISGTETGRKPVERTGRILAVGDLRAEETTLTAIRLPIEPALLQSTVVERMRELNRPGEIESAQTPIQELLAVLLLYQ